MFMTFQFCFFERTGKFMIVNKKHFKEGGKLIARQGANEEQVYSLAILYAMVSLKTDSIKRFSLTFK